MDREFLKDCLDGFIAYDEGCVDSGIHHPELRDQCRAEIEAHPELVQQFADELYQEPEYGPKDRAGFIEWARWDL